VADGIEQRLKWSEKASKEAKLADNWRIIGGYFSLTI